MTKKRMLLSRHIKASSFSVTIIIALVIGLLSMLLILQAYYTKNIQTRIFIDEKLRDNLDAVVDISLGDTGTIGKELIRYFDLYDKRGDSVFLEKFNWGVYQVGVGKAWGSGKESSKEWMMGRQLPSFLKSCIYLVDHEGPLSLVGDTKLTGDAYLPKAGLRAAYINQNGYHGEKLLYGDPTLSGRVPPGQANGFSRYLKSLLFPSVQYQNSNLPEKDGSDSVVKKFSDLVSCLHQTGVIRLENIYLKGHIIIQSDTLIEIENTAVLQDILCIAPEVRIKTGFKGRLQVFASEKISVEDSCKLQYPSALILIKDGKTLLKTQPSIRIGKNCGIDGGIYTFCENDDINKTSVEVMDSCRLNGIFYVNGYLSLKSDVVGCVLTDFIIFRSGNSIYENHLVDRKIDRRGLSENFTGPSFFQERTKNKVIEWLN